MYPIGYIESDGGDKYAIIRTFKSDFFSDRKIDDPKSLLIGARYAQWEIHDVVLSKDGTRWAILSKIPDAEIMDIDQAELDIQN